MRKITTAYAALIRRVTGLDEALCQSTLKRSFSGQLGPQDPTDEPTTQTRRSYKLTVTLP